MSLFGYGLNTQLDSLQYALAGAIATAHQTPKLGKREILIPLGGNVVNTRMTKTGDKWIPVTVTDSVQVTEKTVETQLLASGLCIYQEKEKVATKNKLRTTSEYIRIPHEADVFELSAPQGTPLSDALLSSLKANNPSAALISANEAYWGEPNPQGILKVLLF